MRKQQFKFPEFLSQEDGYRTNCPYCGNALEPVENTEIISQFCERCSLPINDYQLGRWED